MEYMAAWRCYGIMYLGCTIGLYLSSLFSYILYTYGFLLELDIQEGKTLSGLIS